MRRVAISAGHSNTPGKDQGAVGNGLIEGVETVKIRDGLKAALALRGVRVSVDPNDSVTKQTVALFSQYFRDKDVVIDIHLNAANSPAARGTEVIIPNSPSDFEVSLANDVAYCISHTLGIPNRGVKAESQTARKKLLWMTIPAETILIEVYFISSPDDVKAFKANAQAFYTNLATVINNHLNR